MMYAISSFPSCDLRCMCDPCQPFLCFVALVWGFISSLLFRSIETGFGCLNGANLLIFGKSTWGCAWVGWPWVKAQVRRIVIIFYILLLDDAVQLHSAVSLLHLNEACVPFRVLSVLSLHVPYHFILFWCMKIIFKLFINIQSHVTESFSSILMYEGKFKIIHKYSIKCHSEFFRINR